MKKAILSLMILGLISWTGCATTQTAHDDGGMHAPMTQHYEDSIFKVTENGEFSVEVLFPDKKVEMGVNNVDLIIHNKKDEDVTGAKITVTPWMPSMGHGVMETPVANEKGGGLYNVKNVVFSMTGDWELRLEIASGSTADSVKIPLPPVGAMGHTHTMKAPSPSEIDTSMEKTSMKGQFNVSYKSDVHPIPVNRLLSWNLDVKTADGQPVKNAQIKILGDMPEHGHGFPTEPEVSGTMEDGQFLVEGLKFSMPGWWVVTFHITAGEMMDQVSFNLLLN
ncbi:MAG: FixH family protein [bacterium]|nr:FixH family protein [bacterium]